MSNVLVTKYSFTMPEVGGTELIVIKTPTCVNLIDGCWLWNPSVGYLEVDASNGTDNIIVTNPGRLENAKSGTQFPSCMEFFVDAPTALPVYDQTVTCLTADFISPDVGETGIMVVDETANIRESDIIIIDRQYRYTVIEVLDEHRLLVRNEGDGKEGIIKAECDRCVSVKVLYSTYCCKVVREELQAEIDDINDRLNNKKSILAWSGNNVVTVYNGTNALTDATNDCTIKVEIPKGNLTVTSTDNVLTINSGSGTDALLKNANINLDLSAFAKTSDIPAVNNGILTIQKSDGTAIGYFRANQANNTTVTLPPINDGILTIKDSGGNTLGSFTANQSGNTTITVPVVPPIPTVPSVYSGYTAGQYLMLSDYNIALNSGDGYVLENPATSGAPKSAEQPLTSEFPTITLASPNTSGHNINIVGSIFVRCEGWFHTDTHTYPDSGYHSLVTARGPLTEFFVTPVITVNGVDYTPYSNSISSGKDFHLALDKLGTVRSENTEFSQQLTIPIVYEINPSSTNTIHFTSKFWADGLRTAGGSSSDVDTFYNEDVKVKILRLKIFVALLWVIK